MSLKKYFKIIYWFLIYFLFYFFTFSFLCIFPKFSKAKYNCGPRISAQCISHSNGELDFYLKMIYWLFENDLESPLIFVLFLKGKQNKKEKP